MRHPLILDSPLRPGQKFRHDIDQKVGPQILSINIVGQGQKVPEVPGKIKRDFPVEIITPVLPIHRQEAQDAKTMLIMSISQVQGKEIS